MSWMSFWLRGSVGFELAERPAIEPFVERIGRCAYAALTLHAQRVFRLVDDHLGYARFAGRGPGERDGCG